MSKLKHCILLFLVSFGNLFGIYLPEEPLSLVETDCDVSVFIDDCVNTISGSFSDSEVDLILPGPEPIVFQRTYNSTDTALASLSAGWRHNYYSELYLGESPDSMKEMQEFYYIEPVGSGSFYHGYWKLQENAFTCTAGYFAERKENRGGTNVGRGEISGRTNLRNQWFEMSNQRPFQDQPIWVHTGKGDQKVYKFYDDYKSSPKYRITHETKVSGNQMNYAYSNGYLMEVSSDSSYKENFGSISFCYSPKMKKSPYLQIKGSDGRVVSYKFKLNKTNHNLLPYIEEVDRPNAPKQSYEYLDIKKTNRSLISKKKSPENRYKEVEYYTSQDNLHIPYPYRDKFSYRVKSLKAPVGMDATPILTHQFVYYYDQNFPEATDPDFAPSGRTEVFDAYNRKKSYSYDRNHRLTAIEDFSGSSNHKSYSKDCYYWLESGLLTGCLSGKNRFASDGSVLFSQFYTYDNRGNILVKSLTGNLTGRGSSISIGTDHRPVTGEQYSISYTYSDDDLNLVLSENDGRKTIVNHYKAGTDQKCARLTYDSGQITTREFFVYDHHGTLIKEFIDNGFSEDKNDLSGVTERRIKEIVAKKEAPCIGYPIIIIDKCLDLQTGIEKLLKKTAQTYSTEGFLLTRDTYDAQDHWCYQERWEYNAMGQETYYQDPMGFIYQKEYDANGNLVLEKGPRIDDLKEHLYDFSNRLVSTKEQVGDEILSTSYFYDYVGNKVGEVDPLGNRTTYQYDDFNRLTQIVYPKISPNQDLSIIQREYDTLGHLVLEISPLQGKTHFVNNVRGQPVKTTSSDDRVEEKIYTLDGLLEKHLFSDQSFKIYTYDYQKRPIREETFGSNGTLIKAFENTYDAFHLIATKDPEGNIITYTYDGAGRKIRESQENKQTEFVYDSLGRLEKEISSSGSVTVFQYDFLNRKIEERVESRSGVVLKKIGYAYDAVGNQTHLFTHSEEGEGLFQTEYNSRNQPIKKIDSYGHVTEIHYDYHQEGGMQTIEISPLGIATITHYNYLADPIRREIRDSLGKTIALEENDYDLNHNHTSSTQHIFEGSIEKRSVTTEWEYDLCNRLITTIEAVGTPEQKITRNRYNTFGQKSKCIKPDGIELLHVYDEIGRLKEFGASDRSFQYVYTYDRNDQVIDVVDQLGSHTRRIYDAFQQLKEETFSNGLSIRYTYNNAGQLEEILLPDETKTLYTYDALFLRSVRRGQYIHSYDRYDLSGNILEETHAGVAGKQIYRWDRMRRLQENQHQIFFESQFNYDIVGNLIGVSQDGVDQSYAYDSLNQLTSEQGLVSHKYTCDSIYNRTSKDGSPYTLNALNQVLSDSEHSLDYDLNGNLIRYKGMVFAYDALNRLIEVKSGKKVYTYTYDAFNRRVSKTEGKKRTLYLYQGQEEIGSFINGSLQDLKVLGNSSMAILMQIGSSNYVPIHDYRGNIVSLVCPKTNEKKGIYRFSAYSEEKSLGILSPWRLGSKRVDEETGLINFGRRYYLPSIGRWISQDPSGYEDGPNLYAYVHNNPFRYIDPNGLSSSELPSFSELYEQSRYDKLSEGLAYSNRDQNYEEHTFQEERSWGYRLLDNALWSLDVSLGLLTLGEIALAVTGAGLPEAALLATIEVSAHEGVSYFRRSITKDVVRKAEKRAVKLNTFHTNMLRLDEVTQQNTRVLRGWARSKGYQRLPNPKGRPEHWGVYKEGEFSWRLKIKPEPSFRSGLKDKSFVPRFSTRIDYDYYINPFDGIKVSQKEGKHFSLKKHYMDHL